MNTLKKELPVILFLLVLLNISTAFAAVQPTLSLLQTEMYANSNMMLFAKVDIDPGDAVQADVYIRATLPDGSDYYLTGQNTFLEEPHAIVTNWKVSKLNDFKVLSMLLPGSLPKGAYSWEVFFIKPGGKITNAADLIAKHKFDFNLKDQPAAESKLLTFTSDKANYSVGEKMKLFIEADPEGKSEIFDLYVSLIDAEGKKSDLGPDLQLTQASRKAVPVVKDFVLSSKVDKFKILELDLPEGTKPGTYSWRIIAVNPGKDPALAANHVFTDEIFAGVVDPQMIDLSRCPGLSTVGACGAEYMPRKQTTSYIEVGGFPHPVIHEAYDPCGYNLNDAELAEFQQTCAVNIANCRNNDTPTLSKCADTAYNFSGCGSILRSECRALVNDICPGENETSCREVLMSNNIANQCQPDFEQEIFGQNCYNNFCSHEPTLEQCLSLDFRMTDYCATGTPATRDETDPIPGAMTEDFAQADSNTLLIDPYFGERFAEDCEPVIQKEIEFCKALREQKAIFIFNQSPAISYYSYYIKPFIAYDPVEDDSVFYPPEEFALCSVTPEFPAARIPEILPLYNQFMFLRYEEIVRNNQWLSVFDALIQTEQLNPGQFGEDFSNVMEANRAVVEENLSFGVDQVGAGMGHSEDLAAGSDVVVAGVSFINTKVVSVADLYAAIPSNIGLRSADKRALAANFVAIEDAQNLTLENKIINSIAALNIFTQEDTEQITDRFSMADLSDINNLTLPNCSTYTYNKYFSYSILRDKIINSTSMLDAVAFAYAPDIAPYSLGFQAANGAGIVRKSGEEVYTDHIDTFSCVADLLHSKSKRLTLSSTVLTPKIIETTLDPKVVESTIATLDPKILEALTADPKLLEAVVKDPTVIGTVIKDDPLLLDTTIVDLGNIVKLCTYTKHEFADTGIRRSKNFFIDVLSQFSAYSGPTTTKEQAGRDMSFSPLGESIEGVLPRLSELDTTVNENWTYYQDRLNELPSAFQDSGFDSYRAYRIKLLDLLILRGRVEKSYAESQGVVFSAENEDPYKKLTLNADTYIGTLSMLTGLTTITEEEKDIIYGELSKPVFNKNLFYKLGYNAFLDIYDLPGILKQDDLAIQVKPDLASTIKVPARLTPVADLAPLENTSDSHFMVEGHVYEFSPVVITYPELFQNIHKHGPPEITAILNHDSTLFLLDEIDIEINKVLNAVAADHPECFSTSGSACDWFPEHFVERIDGLVPEGILNQANEQCNVMVGLEDNDRVFRTNDFEFVINPDTLKIMPAHLDTTNEICNVLPPGPHSTNKSGLSDSALCRQLAQGFNYRAGTLAFERFYEDGTFFNAVPNAVAAYLLFAENGIDDSRINAENRKRADTAAQKLFLGLSYSDTFDTGSDWLGLEGGFGIGAGISDFDSILTNVFNPNLTPEQKAVNKVDLKASFFGHAYMEGKLLKLDFDIFRATAFASSKNGFANDPKSFMPGVKEQVREHSKETIGNKKYFSEINILGYEVYKIAQDDVETTPDTRSKRADWSGGKTLEYNLLSQTIVVIVPIVIEVDSGLAWDYLLHANPPELRSLVDVTFEPNASVYIRFAAGVGFDIGVAAASVGIEGFLDLLVSKMPFNLNVSTDQETFNVDGFDIWVPKITYDNNFSYRIAFGSGKIGLYAKVRIGWGWLSYSKSARKTLFDFSDQPLWSREHSIFSMDGEYSLGQIFQGYGLLNP